MEYIQLQIKYLDKILSIMTASTVGIHFGDPSDENLQVSKETITPPSTNIP